MPVQTVQHSAVQEDGGCAITNSFRTLVYTASVIILLVCSLSLAAYVLDHVHGVAYEGLVYENMAGVNYLLAMLITFIMLPLFVILPAMFLRRRVRLMVSLCLNVGTGFLLTMFMMTGIIWAALCPTSVLLTKMMNLAVQLVTSLMLLCCVTTLLKIRIRRYQEKVPTGVYSAVGLDQGLHHASLVFLTFGAAILATLGEGMSANTNTSSITYPSMLTLFLVNMLLLVQVKHYTRTHVGWYTLSRAKKRVEHFIRQYPLSELERELVNEKKLTARVIEGAFTASIYDRPVWAC